MLDVGDVGVKKIQPVASWNFSLPPSLDHFLLTTQAERTKYEDRECCGFLAANVFESKNDKNG